MTAPDPVCPKCGSAMLESFSGQGLRCAANLDGSGWCDTLAELARLREENAKLKDDVRRFESAAWERGE